MSSPGVPSPQAPSPQAPSPYAPSPYAPSPYAPSPYAPSPYSQVPVPRRPGRRGPPLWLGIVVLLLGPAAFVGMMIMVAMPLAEAITKDLIPAANGRPVTLPEGGDYFVMTPALGDTTTPCALKLPGSPSITLEEPPRGSSSDRVVPHEGEQYVMRGYFPVDQGGKVRITCPGAGDRLMLFQWPGGIKHTVKLAGIGTVVAGVLFLAGLVMIVLRRRHPVW